MCLTGHTSLLQGNPWMPSGVPALGNYKLCLLHIWQMFAESFHMSDTVLWVELRLRTHKSLLYEVDYTWDS